MKYIAARWQPSLVGILGRLVTRRSGRLNAPGRRDSQPRRRSRGEAGLSRRLRTRCPTGWDFTDRAAWRITPVEPGRNRVLELFRASKYEPPVRSPFNIALAQEVDRGRLRRWT